MKDLFHATFSHEFIEKWKGVLMDLYSYKFYEEFAVVPSLIGKNTYSYLPLLNYTDKKSHEVSEMVGKVRDKKYQIRILNPAVKDFQKFDTVTMRIDLQKKNIEELFQTVVSKRNRRYIRQHASKKIVIRRGNSGELIKDFYNIFANVMHRHGTPVFSHKLFMMLPKNLETTFYVLYDNEIPKAAAVILDDHKISWIPWSGTHSQHLDNRPGLLVYWETIKDAFLKRKLIYDYGRSSYGSGTYIFKTRWGAVPVKIDIIQPKPSNVYKKYSYLSHVWKKIPSDIARWLGPKVCKYLSDL